MIHRGLLLSTALVGLTLAPPALADDDRNYHTLPLPAAASPELQRAIEDSPTSMLLVTPTTMDEWREEIARRQSIRAQLADELAKRKRVSIEKSNMAGVTVYRVTPPTIDPRFEHALFVYLHGGAYVYGGGPGNVFEAIMIAETIGIRAISIDFRMPPDHPAPQAVEDVVAVFSAIIENYAPSQVALGGTSSGGGLTLATVHRLIELNLPVPAALYAGTPWADLTETSDSLHVNRNVDRVLRNYDGLLKAGASLYAG